jgi:plastocyanin
MFRGAAHLLLALGGPGIALLLAANSLAQNANPPPHHQTNPYDASPAAAAVAVRAHDNYFEPQTIRVAPGTTIRWLNAGKHNHTVTFKDGGADSGDIRPGGTYQQTFRQPGTYRYYCRHHTKDKMQGVIVVRSGDSDFAEVNNLASLDPQSVRVRPGSLIDVRRVTDDRKLWTLVQGLNANPQAYRNTEALTERLQSSGLLRPGERVVGYADGRVYVMRAR